MENLTIGQVAVAVAFLGALIAGVKYLLAEAKTWITESMKTQMDAFSVKIEALEDKISDVDMESCKNYLVTFLSGVEKDHLIDEIERERFWEQYAHYRKKGGNSYIERKVEQLKSEGKL